MANGPPRGSLAQDRVFYSKEWTREVDRVFIRALTDQTVHGKLIIHGAPDRAVITYGMSTVNAVFNKSFDYDFCEDRFRKLYKRFRVFNWIIKQDGVVHYTLNHQIDCDDATWNAICRHDALGLAYMRQGEAEYDNLQFIFTAAHDTDSEPEQDGANLSSGNPDNQTVSADPTDDCFNAFSYEIAWYTSPTRNDTSGSSFSSYSGASSNVRKSKGKRLTTKRPSCPNGPTPPGPSSVASSSPFKKP